MLVVTLAFERRNRRLVLCCVLVPNCALHTSPRATECHAVFEAAIESALKRLFNALLNAFLRS